MKLTAIGLATACCTFVTGIAYATQADDTTITIAGQTPGTTPFISQVALTVSDVTVVKSIQFTITPKNGSVTRPLSGTYSSEYLTARGDLIPGTGEIFLPVYGLYSGYANTVTLTYTFLDGSNKQDVTMITTSAFSDPCGYNSPTYNQHRTQDTTLSFDYILIKGTCSGFSPAIIDTDGALRWMSVTAPNFSSFTAGFFDNAAYYAHGPQLYRCDFDGTFSLVADYASVGVSNFHHNIDLGKTGLILEADTPAYAESVIMEVDGAGTLLKTWNMADIISAAMIAGGDDPTQFVYPSPTDWFHSNAVTYNRADDSLIVSSRENFLICIDYDTGAIKWILGDPTKKWHQFPSLAKYSLDTAPGSLPPIGQHSISVTFDQNIMMFDNGLQSFVQMPVGAMRDYASPRKYQLNLPVKLATEVWNYERDQTVFSPICGSVYEDAPLNYLIDYADVNGFSAPVQYAQLLGLNGAGEQVFQFQYPTEACSEAFNATPLHLESTSFPTVQPRALNLSTRGVVGTGDESLIGGFIVSGTSPLTVALRALGPSLSPSVPAPVANPRLTLFDATGAVIATNDDWQSDSSAAQIAADSLAPTDPLEAATIQTLPPGTYTFIVSGSDSAPGVGLVEAYNLSPTSTSKLANLSARAFAGTDDDVLISGFIVGQVDSDTVVIRALGASLASKGIADPLSDPMLTVYDANGGAIVSNDNWRDDPSAIDIENNDLAPADDKEAATILHLPAGAYTSVVTGADGATGVSLVEVYDLN